MAGSGCAGKWAPASPKQDRPAPLPDYHRFAVRPTEPSIPPSPLGLSHAQYLSACSDLGIHAKRASEMYHKAFRDGLLPEPHAPQPIAQTLTEETPEGLTTKFLTTVPGTTKGPLAGDPNASTLEVESVVIPMLTRSGRRTFTLCVSSQVGCAMGCGFCETAQMGLIRSLTVSEIVGQWFNARHTLGNNIANIVFMGMGEPMDNLDAVLQAVDILTDHHGASIPMSKVTISTVGRIDGIRVFGERIAEPGWKRLGLAISVNAPNDEIRDELMPINRGMPMAELQQALLDLPMVRTRKICFEYVLIPGVNDQQDHARQLAAFLRPWASTPDRPVPNGLVNLIPYNPRRNSPWPAPEESAVEAFMSWLIEEGLFVKRRRTKGRSAMAACGQLGAAHIRKRRFVELSTPTGDA